MNREEQIFRDASLILLVVDTRIKISELLKLKRKHFDLKEGHLLLDKTFKHPRILHFRKQLSDILEKYWSIVGIKNEEDVAFWTLGFHGPHQKRPITRCALGMLMEGGMETLRKVGCAKINENYHNEKTLRQILQLA